ncbi:sensor domain-containing diguanylate cyclase [Caldimonas aquatica]|uniref:Diguanylate cyclase n=1 Tax=Caldimonas aquatica TaxID=376175 RepID=A0ABY6MM47_9BURK|nr:sensor domain-containing diguanylate cyclase [Schlegelella aquatica]UZD53597.1 diguanylate cyclase [Schlegelella aquatica]
MDGNPAARMIGWWHGVRASVRGSLLLLVVACVLPVALGAALAIVEAYREGRASLFERALSSSRSMMGVVDGELRYAASGLQLLATSPSLARADFQAFHAQASLALAFHGGNNIVLSAPGGQQLLNTLVRFGEPLPMHGDPALLRRVIATGEPQVSDLFIGGVTRRPLVAVEVPVKVDGRVAYGLAMGFFPERFEALVSGLRPDDDWVVSVFDRHGTIVARTHAPERFVGQRGSPALDEAMQRSDSGLVEAETLEGVTVLAAFSRSPVTGWTVAVGIPKEALLAKLQRWVAGLVAASLLLMAVATVLASRIAARLARSMRSLVELADALGRGEPIDAPRQSLREVDAVAQALLRSSNLLEARTLERDTAHDATAAARMDATRMRHAAEHDVLTGLPNRARFVEELEARVEECVARHEGLAVFFVDIDDFKPVNDRYGHLVGDELLRDFAARLKAGVRGTDLVARLGGDEFAVLLQGVSPGEAQAIAATLAERLSAPYSVQGTGLRVTACIGIANCPADGTSAMQLLAVADAAMYRAKAAGKGGYAMAANLVR